MKKLFIIGSSGHAKVIIDIIMKEKKYKIVGLIDDFKKAGITVLGVSADSPESHVKFREKYNLPFTLLSDPDQKVIKEYGAFAFPFNKRISYLISNGIIVKTYPKVDPANHALAILEDINKI